MSRLLLSCTMAVLAMVPVGVLGQEVENTSFSAPDGSRVLQHRIVIPASLPEVWSAFTTAEGIQSWAVPVASVDFRLGGIWESSYELDAKIGDPNNIQNRFISFLPLKMISMQAVQAPPDFPHPELLPELFTVIELEPLAPEQVQVTISMVGYRDESRYDTIAQLFDAGNAWSLSQLHRRFVEGPTDWEKQLSSTPAP